MIRRRRKYTKLFGKFPKLYTIIGAGLLFVLLIIILFPNAATVHLIRTVKP